MRDSQLPTEEVARLGDQWYHGRVRPLVEASYQGSIVAIDVLTGDYALGDTSLAAARLLRATQPHAEVWLVRVGYRTLHKGTDIRYADYV